MPPHKGGNSNGAAGAILPRSAGEGDAPRGPRAPRSDNGYLFSHRPSRRRPGPAGAPRRTRSARRARSGRVGSRISQKGFFPVPKKPGRASPAARPFVGETEQHVGVARQVQGAHVSEVPAPERTQIVRIFGKKGGQRLTLKAAHCLGVGLWGGFLRAVRVMPERAIACWAGIRQPFTSRRRDADITSTANWQSSGAYDRPSSPRAAALACRMTARAIACPAVGPYRCQPRSIARGAWITAVSRCDAARWPAATGCTLAHAKRAHRLFRGVALHLGPDASFGLARSEACIEDADRSSPIGGLSCSAKVRNLSHESSKFG